MWNEYFVQKLQIAASLWYLCNNIRFNQTSWTWFLWSLVFISDGWPHLTCECQQMKKLTFSLVLSDSTMDIRPNHTIYINNINDTYIEVCIHSLSDVRLPCCAPSCRGLNWCPLGADIAVGSIMSEWVRANEWVFRWAGGGIWYSETERKRERDRCFISSGVSSEITEEREKKQQLQSQREYK